MKDSIRQRLDRQLDRFEEVARLLADPGLDGGSGTFRDLSMEYAKLTPLTERYQAFRSLERDLAAAKALASDPDPEMRMLGEEEARRLQETAAVEELALRRLLVPADPRDSHNIYLEVRAGTGGDE